MATSDHDFKYDGQVTITLALHDDEISVWPSNELKGGVAISLLDSEEPRTNVGIASPAEWDAFVAAGNAALGRPAPISTPLEERVAAAASAVDRDASELDYGPMRWEMRGRAEGLRAALAMVREQGATVSRAGVPTPDAEPLFYIWDTRSFVGDSILWWRPKSSGYTVNLDEAGTYTAEQCRGNRDTDRPVPVEIARAVCSQHVIAGRLRRALEEAGAAHTTPPEKG